MGYTWPDGSAFYDNGRRVAWKPPDYRGDMGSAAITHPPSYEFRRLYYFTRLEHAIDDIQNGWLKVARWRDMNDPFELLAFNVLDKRVRNEMEAHVEAEAAATGLLCFAEDWTSPVMWAHYGGRHSGVCLGLNVRRTTVEAVRYIDRRQTGDWQPESWPTPSAEQRRILRITKASDWKYEREHRVVVELATTAQRDGLRFARMGEELQLAEVVLGPRCSDDDYATVREVVGTGARRPLLFRARLGWGHFKVVPWKP